MNICMIFIIITISTSCYLPQRLNSAIKKKQWFILNFDYIRHVLNIHINLRTDNFKALFILIQQNKIMVIITQGHPDMINVNTFIVQPVQVVEDILRGLNDILDDDDAKHLQAFLNALVLSAVAYVFDSYYEETIDGESNSASIISKRITDYFDYEY